MRELKLHTNEDYPQYKLQVKGFKGLKEIDVYLKQDYNKVGDGIYWLMQTGSIILAHYPKELIENQNRLKKEDSLKNEEIVIINGEQYKLKVLGDFSDAGVFEKIEG